MTTNLEARIRSLIVAARLSGDTYTSDLLGVLLWVHLDGGQLESSHIALVDSAAARLA
jgi:hypothetical protein